MNYTISLGGSLIAPDGIDLNFLRKFKALILSAVKKGNKFFIIPGGGQTCRNYQTAARNIGKITNDDLDWIGIAVNKLHSEFIRAIFGREAHSEIINLNSASIRIKKDIIICVGGLKPGGTSDSTAVKFAQKFGAKTIVNLTNVAGVYNKDPRKLKNARLIPKMTWPDLKRQFGTGKIPGRHMPFDSSTANLAAKLKLKVVILHGRNLKNFQNFLASKHFRGTIVESN